MMFMTQYVHPQQNLLRFVSPIGNKVLCFHLFFQAEVFNFSLSDPSLTLSAPATTSYRTKHATHPGLRRAPPAPGQ